ncbi:hypothetical protein B0H15DRAFT_957421 [Mycena belliarum]|uniref:Uncharacterized protein n=1 Tax=Mycena belliarum TaxID=1033014 RepID=A0AAD6XGQ2_9AGAR|nr:hypothetical protein B0H15DRAFT_957421 [Mycena belliae]
MDIGPYDDTMLSSPLVPVDSDSFTFRMKSCIISLASPQCNEPYHAANGIRRLSNISSDLDLRLQLAAVFCDLRARSGRIFVRLPRVHRRALVRPAPCAATALHLSVGCVMPGGLRAHLAGVLAAARRIPSLIASDADAPPALHHDPWPAPLNSTILSALAPARRSINASYPARKCLPCVPPSTPWSPSGSASLLSCSAPRRTLPRALLGPAPFVLLPHYL